MKDGYFSLTNQVTVFVTISLGIIAACMLPTTLAHSKQLSNLSGHTAQNFFSELNQFIDIITSSQQLTVFLVYKPLTSNIIAVHIPLDLVSMVMIIAQSHVNLSIVDKSNVIHKPNEKNAVPFQIEAL